MRNLLVQASVVASMAFSVVAFGAAGNVLSSFSSGHGSAYGLEIRQVSGGTDLYVITGSSALYKYNVATPGTGTLMTAVGAAAGDGSQIEGLAICPTWEGPYGTEFIAVSGNRTTYRSIWGNDGGGDTNWYQFWGGGAITSTGDICSSGGAHSGVWTVSGTTLYSLDYPTWGMGGTVASYDLGVNLAGVSLGSNNDLWVLAKDGKVFNLNASDGSTLRTFQINPTLTDLWGVAYDSSSQSLWVSQTNGTISQIDTVPVPEAATLTLMMSVGLLALRRR